jgi:site-specific DNA-methyltransferase (adenine-specific)
VSFICQQGDAIEKLMELDDQSVDLVITDPAYESLEKYRNTGTTTRLKKSKGSSNSWFPIFPNSRFPGLFRELYRVMKKNTHLYMFSDAETMFVIKPLAEEAGFKFWKPLVWDKGTIGMGYHYRARYEFILFFEKGKRGLNDLAVPDVLNVPKIHSAKVVYPTEKPLQLVKTLISQSSEQGELVLDPFAGSGVVLLAAESLERNSIGFDISERAVTLASKMVGDV